jgi:HK97 family phage major capsid protein
MTIDIQKRDALIAKYIGTQAGRQVLATSMQQPLRLRRDYASVGRKTFLVEQLPDGALPYYDKDPEVTAYVIGEEGENILSVTRSRRVSFPLFELASNPTVPLSQIRERRFDVLQRVQDLARAQIQAAEDDRVFQIMDAVAGAGFDNVPNVNPDIPVVAPISGAAIADAMASIEQWDLSVQRIFMNARDFADIRKFNRDILDPDSQRSLLVSGSMATIYGASVITSRIVPQGTVYFTCDPEHFGRIPVRTELTVLSADEPSRRSIGFSVFENIGIGCFNPLGLQRLVVTR